MNRPRVPLSVRLAARAVRWRAGASVAVFVVAALAALAATLGPVYSTAAGASVLASRLQQTRETSRDVRVSAQLDPTAGRNTDPVQAVRVVANVAAKSRWFGQPTLLRSTTVTTRTPAVGLVDGRIATMAAACGHLVLAQGRCPTGPGEAMLSTRSATLAGWHLGDRVGVMVCGNCSPSPVRLVGLYRVPLTSSGFWAAWPLFDQHLAEFTGQSPQLDTLFLSGGVLTLGNGNNALPQSVIADVPLLLTQVRLADEGAIRGVLHRVNDEAGRQSASGPAPIDPATPLLGVLATIDHEKDVAGTLVDLATEQLAVLAVIVLGGIVAAIAGARSGEVALAKLRGHRPVAVAAQALFEPVSLIVLAAPVGAVLAWLLVRLTSGHVFGPGTPVLFPPTAYGLAAAAAGAAILVAAVAGRRMLAAPVTELLRRGTDTAGARSRGVLAADVAVVVLAAGGLAQLAIGGVLAGGKTNPFAALAPTLLAAAVAVLGLRLLPYPLRIAIGRSVRSRGMATYLAVRQLGRRPHGSRMALLIAVATALAIIAIATWSVAARNRQYRAVNQIGASSVLTVTPKPGVDLLGAVRRADPAGRSAMAAELLPTNSTQLIAVDTGRMAGIAGWRPDYAGRSLSQVIRTLQPALSQPVLLRGTAVQAGIRLVTPTTDTVSITLTVAIPDYSRWTVTLGPIRPGQASYRAELPDQCPAGCRVTGLAVQRAHGSGRGRLQLVIGSVTSVSGHSDGLDHLIQPRFWRTVDNSGMTLTSGGDGLTIRSPQADGAGSWGTLASTDAPAVLPAVVAPETRSVYPEATVHDISAQNLDASSVDVDGLVAARTLPRLDRSGVLVDLTLAERAMTASDGAGLVYQVWLAPNAPHALLVRLQQQGLRVDARQDAATVRTRLDHTGPALADTSFVIAAIAAGVLAVAAAVLAGLLTARRRAYELAALLAVGVRVRTVRAAAALESALVAGVGLLLGVVAGIGGSVLALPSTPVFVDTDVGPPVETALPVAVVALTVAVLAVALAITCVLLAAGIVRLATPERLREAPT